MVVVGLAIKLYDPLEVVALNILYLVAPITASKLMVNEVLVAFPTLRPDGAVGADTNVVPLALEDRVPSPPAFVALTL